MPLRFTSTTIFVDFSTRYYCITVSPDSQAQIMDSQGNPAPVRAQGAALWGWCARRRAWRPCVAGDSSGFWVFARRFGCPPAGGSRAWARRACRLRAFPRRRGRRHGVGRRGCRAEDAGGAGDGRPCRAYRACRSFHGAPWAPLAPRGGDSRRSDRGFCPCRRGNGCAGGGRRGARARPRTARARWALRAGRRAARECRRAAVRRARAYPPVRAQVRARRPWARAAPDRSRTRGTR